MTCGLLNRCFGKCDGLLCFFVCVVYYFTSGIGISYKDMHDDDDDDDDDDVYETTSPILDFERKDH